MKEYEPHLGEIVGQMIGNAGARTRQFGMGVVEGLYAVNAYPTFAVSERQSMDAARGQERFPWNVEQTGWTLTGTMCGIILGVSELIGVHHMVFAEKEPKYLAIPVATNVVSGVYELVRKAYCNAKEQVKKEYEPTKGI